LKSFAPRRSKREFWKATGESGREAAAGQMTISADERRAARELVGMSQEVLANVSRVSRSTIIVFENRHKLPRYNKLEAIRRALEAAGVDFPTGGQAEAMNRPKLPSAEGG
jgi:transcriptional regulator with XRE-family HTH domain